MAHVYRDGRYPIDVGFVQITNLGNARLSSVKASYTGHLLFPFDFFR